MRRYLPGLLLVSPALAIIVFLFLVPLGGAVTGAFQDPDGGFSFGNFMRHHPDLRGTVTDLLIGDLFTDKVDTVWKPMESLYPPGKTAIPSWNAGLAPEAVPEKANELKLPEGWRP